MELKGWSKTSWSQRLVKGGAWVWAKIDPPQRLVEEQSRPEWRIKILASLSPLIATVRKVTKSSATCPSMTCGRCILADVIAGGLGSIAAGSCWSIFQGGTEEEVNTSCKAFNFFSSLFVVEFSLQCATMADLFFICLTTMISLLLNKNFPALPRS